MTLRSRYALWAALGAIAIGALSAQAQVPGVNSTLQSVFTLAYDNSTMKPTYSATKIVVPAAGATDICTLSGSATKNVRLRRILFSGISSAIWTEPVSIIKRSANNTGGTQQLISSVAYDSTNLLTGSTSNAATALVESFTANPTLGTFVGLVADVFVGFGNLTTGLGAPTVFTFGNLGSPIVLRGAAQQIAVNLNGITYTTGQMSCTFEWTEE